MISLQNQIKNCTTCEASLELGCRPVCSFSASSKIVIIGQAPGKRVHESGIPWDDKSGENLRAWMGINDLTFYDNTKVAIVPMGFCYPGKGKSGDLPPREECAPKWHPQIWDTITNRSLTLLIGQYAQAYYLKRVHRKKNLTETVRNFESFLPEHFVLPHPSPRNNIWMAKNPWFEHKVLPSLKKEVALALQ